MSAQDALIERLRGATIAGLVGADTVEPLGVAR
jgi:hypothetical protein